MSSFVKVLAVATVLVSSAASAQIQTLPQEGRAETRASGINNGLVVQERNRAGTQQNQFEINALRNQPATPPMAGPPAFAPGPGRR